tara:strand:+ start:2797 stop:2973 length:177 start_codon:yes stop_codon:yes gene_type:complete
VEKPRAVVSLEVQEQMHLMEPKLVGLENYADRHPETDEFAEHQRVDDLDKEQPLRKEV